MKQILNLSAWQARVFDVVSCTISFKSTQTEYLARVDATIWQELKRKHGKRAVYSAWVQGYVSGMLHAKYETMCREDIEFCYIVDGVMYSTHRESTHKTTRFYCEHVNPKNGGAVLCSDETPRGLFWRGTDKRFF